MWVFKFRTDFAFETISQFIPFGRSPSSEFPGRDPLTKGQTEETSQFVVRKSMNTFTTHEINNFGCVEGNCRLLFNHGQITISHHYLGGNICWKTLSNHPNPQKSPRNQKKSLSCPVGRRKSEALAQPNAIWPHAKGPLWTLVTVVLILTPVTGVSWTDLPMRVGMGFWCLHRDVEYRPY